MFSVFKFKEKKFPFNFEKIKQNKGKENTHIILDTLAEF